MRCGRELNKELVPNFITQVLKSKTAPYHNLPYAIVEYKDWYTIRIRRRDLEEFSDPQRESLVMWLNEILSEVNSVFPKSLYLEVF